MASTSRYPKRSADSLDASNLRSLKRPRNAATTGRSNRTLSLMDLPLEVRSLILKELLWQKEPLEMNRGLYRRLRQKKILSKRERILAQTSPPAKPLYPKVLRLCKQLHSEGSGILYSNTINCRLGHPLSKNDECAHMPRLMGRLYRHSLCDVYPSIIQKISRVRIQLFAHHRRGSRFHHARTMERGVKNVAEILNEHPMWKNITIQMIHIESSTRVFYECYSSPATAFFERSLRQLRYVRNLSSVTMTGVSESIASKLSGVLLSTERFVNLPLAYSALVSYSLILTSHQVFASDHCLQRSSQQVLIALEKCAAAVSSGDLDLFTRSRQQILDVVAVFMTSQQLQAFAHDPEKDHMNARPLRLREGMEESHGLSEDLMPLSAKDTIFPELDESIEHEEDGASDTAEEYDGEEDTDEDWRAIDGFLGVFPCMSDQYHDGFELDHRYEGDSYFSCNCLECNSTEDSDDYSSFGGW